jgi:hypothetical protein
MNRIINSFILLRLIAAGFAFAAIWKHPYNFYILTRWIILVVCAVALWMSKFNLRPNLILGYMALAIVFNPFLPFHFSRDSWHICDTVAGAFLLISLIQRPQNI